MSGLGARRERIAHAVGELAAEVRREDSRERADGMERWRRKQDEPARAHHANGILALRCWIEACGYDLDRTYNALSVAVAAAGGADFEVTRPDWLMGFHLKGGTPEEFARVAALPNKDKDKRALAIAWKRAFEDVQAEQERTGIVSVRRRHGERKGGKNVSSKLHVLCAQDLAEIERSPLRRGRKRFEGFAVAALAQAELIRRDPSRFTRPTPKPDPRPRAPKQEQSLASRRAVFLAELNKLTSDLLRAEIASGATEAELDEIRAAAHEQLEELFADALPCDDSPADAVLCTTSIEKISTQNRSAAQTPKVKSARTLFSATSQNSPENDRILEFGVHRSVYPKLSDLLREEVPDEQAVHERVAELIRGKAISTDDAYDFKSKACDPQFRLDFFRRFARNAAIQGGAA